MNNDAYKTPSSEVIADEESPIKAAKIFRIIVALMLATYVVYVAIPYTWPLLYDQATLNALYWNGYGGSINVYGPVPYVLAATMLISLFGLFFFKIWARNLFFICTIVSLAMGPFRGIVVLGPLESIPSGIISLCMGAILAMSYLSSVKDKFQVNA